MTGIAQAEQPEAATRKPAGHIPGQPDMWVLVRCVQAARAGAVRAAMASTYLAAGARTRRRSFIVLLILVAITLGYLALDRSADAHGADRASTIVTTMAIGLALVKVRLIFREFMQVRNAPALLCRLTDLWVALIAAVLLGSYFLGLAVH